MFGDYNRIRRIKSMNIRIVLFVICAFTAFLLCACGSNSISDNSGNDAESSTSDISSAEESVEENNGFLEFSVLEDGTYEISAYHKDSQPEKLVIPNEYNGKPVTAIAERAFYNASGIKSVIIPKSVIKIGKMAFSGCTSLVNVELPQGLTTIANGAFTKCAFSEFIVPQSVTFIGSGAFGGCNMLQRIELPFIGETPDPSELPYGFIGHIFGTRFGDSEKIYEFIPRALKEVIVSEGCEHIPYGAFALCESIERITFPKTLKSIDSWAFDCCTGLTEINYNGTIKEWNAVQKELSWDKWDHLDKTGYSFNVRCTDGDITIE